MNLTTTNFIDNLKLKKEHYDFVSLRKAEEKFNFDSISLFLIAFFWRI